MEYIFYFILLMYFKHNWMSSTKAIWLMPVLSAVDLTLHYPWDLISN